MVRHPSLALEVSVSGADSAAGLGADPAAGSAVDPAASKSGSGKATKGKRPLRRFSPYQKEVEPSSEPLVPSTCGLSGGLQHMALDAPISSRTRARRAPGFKTREMARALTRLERSAQADLCLSASNESSLEKAKAPLPPLPPVHEVGRRRSTSGMPWHVQQNVLELLDSFIVVQQRSRARPWRPLRQPANATTAHAMHPGDSIGSSSYGVSSVFDASFGHGSVASDGTASDQACLPPLTSSGGRPIHELSAARSSARLPKCLRPRREPLMGELRPTAVGCSGRSKAGGSTVGGMVEGAQSFEELLRVGMHACMACMPMARCTHPLRSSCG